MATLHRLLLVSLFTAFALTAQSTASAQTLPSTGRVANIGYAINNPFTARRISEPLDGSPSAAHRPFEFELVARDSAGRIRLERHDVRKFPAGQKQTVLHSRDGRERTVSEEEMGLLITVFDYPAGKLYAIQPGMQIVHVHERTRPQTSAAPELPYSYFSLSLLHGKPNPAFLAQDLGSKEIDGIPAHGIRTTNLGTDDDEWKGKPVSVSEVWVSDDLAATLIDSRSDLKRGVAGVTRLVDIKRVEPDPSLFEIPSQYKINPIPDEMPYVTGEGKVVVQPNR